MVETRKMALKATALSRSEQLALHTFVRKLQQAYPRQVRQVMLFGSKARGDSDADSDVDVLIIVNQDDRSLRREIIDMASDLSLEYDILLSPRVISEKKWEARRGFSIYQNIARDAQVISTEHGPLD